MAKWLRDYLSFGGRRLPPQPPTPDYTESDILRAYREQKDLDFEDPYEDADSRLEPDSSRARRLQGPWRREVRPPAPAHQGGGSRHCQSQGLVGKPRGRGVAKPQAGWAPETGWGGSSWHSGFWGGLVQVLPQGQTRAPAHFPSPPPALQFDVCPLSMHSAGCPLLPSLIGFVPLSSAS